MNAPEEAPPKNISFRMAQVILRAQFDAVTGEPAVVQVLHGDVPVAEAIRIITFAYLAIQNAQKKEKRIITV